MTTKAELRTTLVQDFLLRPDLMAEADRAIDRAVRTFEAQRFWFNEAVTTLTAVAAQSYLTIPSDFLKLDRLEYTLNSADDELKQLSFWDLRDYQVSRPSGLPEAFCYYADRFELGPIPDSAYTFPCYYLKSLGSLSDGSSVAWTNEAGNLILHTAAIDIYTNVLRDNDGANRHAVGVSLARRDLDKRNQRVGRGKTRATKF